MHPDEPSAVRLKVFLARQIERRTKEAPLNHHEAAVLACLMLSEGRLNQY